MKTEKTGPETSAPSPDKAHLVLVQQLDGDFGAGPISRFAVDGTWLGADKGASFFAVDVTPGAHDLCASRQSGARLEKENIATTKVTLEAGKTYFFQFTIKRSEIGGPEMHEQAQGVPGSSMTSKSAPTVDTADLTQVAPDTGKTLVGKLRRAVSEPK